MTKLTEQQLKEIKELANELKNQDPDGKKWGTRPPLWFCIQDVEQRFDPMNGGDHLVYYDSGQCQQYIGEDVDDIIEQLRGDEEDEGVSCVDIEQDCYPIVYEFVTKRIFHTHKAAKRHLEANHYHYSSKVRIWCDHAWRNPEAELIHNLILSFAD